MDVTKHVANTREDLQVVVEDLWCRSHEYMAAKMQACKFSYNQTVVAGIGDDLALDLHVDARGRDVPAVAAAALNKVERVS